MTNKKAKGKRAKTRDKLKKRGGKLSVNKLLAEISAGQKVQVNIDSSVHSGMPSRRFQGLSGKIAGKRGTAYLVELKEGNKEKELVVHAAHLKVLG